MVSAKSPHRLASTSDALRSNSQTGCEAQLVSAAKRGHAAAFGELWECHAKTIFHTTLRITRNREDAEDALQDSFLSAFVHLGKFDGRSSFATWLTRIAINSALMKLRKNRACREVPMEESFDGGENRPRYEPADRLPGPEERYAQQERDTILRRAIRNLRPNIRKVVEIQQLQELPMKEAAEFMGISVVAAKARLFHARAALRKSRKVKSIRQGWSTGLGPRFARGAAAGANSRSLEMAS
jgi:RNA polymerase sigma factor (sigma-70 family)